MSDMVYQGTVLRPSLWDLFFGDARRAIDNAGFAETIYADGLNAYRILEPECSDNEAFELIRACQ
eukprot:12894214-Alexandrium_andersonii.AAC.1